MKNLKSLFVSALTIAILIIGCTEDDPEIKIENFSFNTVSVEVANGTAVNLNDYLVIEGEDADKVDVTFTSDNTDVVTVDGTTLSAIAVGTATIEALETNTNKSATIDVNVVEKEEIIAVTGITLDKSESNLKVGETLQLTATVAPDNASDQTVNWVVVFAPEGKQLEDTPEDIATVSETGLVTAKAAGNVIVMAKTKDGDFSALVTINVTNVAVTGVTIGSDPIEIEVNESVQLTATVAPENATINTVEWSVSIANDPEAGRVMNIPAVEDYLEITADGLLKAKNKAEPGYIYTVTATTTDGEKTDEATIEITYIPITDVIINEDENFDVIIGQPYQVNFTIVPEDATNQFVEWDILFAEDLCRVRGEEPEGNPYASIDENGLITGFAPSDDISCGYLKISATSEDFDGSVDEDFEVIQLVTGLTILDVDGSPAESTLDIDCSSLDLGHSATPENASNSDVTWSIDNETHFDINQDGVISEEDGLPSGDYSTKVIITANDGSGVTTEITVTYDTDSCE